MMRLIVSVLLQSPVDSDHLSWGNWCTTAKIMSLLSAASLTLIELTDWLSAVRGVFPAPTTRQVQPSEDSEVAGASRVSPLCSPDSLSASWTAQPVRCLGRQPCTPQEAWLRVRP